ncbi:hypothetical protein CAPTEDRAFT_184147 [Capitella teleta]|uniref:Transmembrane protein 198 n=1 Tax=Capitella teleta TaxID=283909 RepID=R7UHI8_CAPTE|nr:hypothetical protein CAPTEDRAFT_184147 [Capitella teleta]|eukprot:ELU05665.1 hypothetical protein CAPTEDRAFT_184147 [Capitella teleta]
MRSSHPIRHHLQNPLKMAAQFLRGAEGHNRTSLDTNMPPSSTRDPPSFTPLAPPASSVLPPSGGPSIMCDDISMNYDVAPAVICAVCFVFAVLYCFFGYRFFKATMFMTGFIFGGLVTYLICLEENLLPLEGKIGASLAAGVLCGLITMLVQYVGLFMTGFNFGLLLAVASLIVLEQFTHPSTKWIPIGTMFGSGLVFALLVLYFQKSLTILGTSLFGAALLMGSLDYFIEMHLMVNYIWERIKAEEATDVCWFSWLVLALWPVAFLVGTVVQARVTGRGFDHHEAVHTRRRRKVNLKRVRRREERRDPTAAASSSAPPPRRATGDTPVSTPGSRYRHLYQIRRVNGDVISQSFIHNMQHCLSPGCLRIPTDYQQTLGPPQALSAQSSSRFIQQRALPPTPPPQTTTLDSVA